MKLKLIYISMSFDARNLPRSSEKRFWYKSLWEARGGVWCVVSIANWGATRGPGYKVASNSAMCSTYVAGRP